MPGRSSFEPTHTHALKHFGGNGVLVVTVWVQGTKVDSKYSTQWELPLDAVSYRPLDPSLYCPAISSGLLRPIVVCIMTLF